MNSINVSGGLVSNMGWVLLVLGLFLFVCLVLVHEYGHYKAARKGGVEVEEFGVGFPPRIWGKKRPSGMTLSVNLLPLGGFVRLKGEHDADTEPGTYGAAPLKTKVKIMTAGVAMNLLAALAILTVLAWVGMPQLVDNQYTVASDSKVVKQEVLVGYLEPDSPADKAGLEQRDVLLAIGTSDANLRPINDINTFPDVTKGLAGQQITLQIKHGDNVENKQIQLRTSEEVDASANTDQPKGYLGVGPTEYTMKRYTWSAPVVAVGTAGQFAWLTLRGLGTVVANLFHGNGSMAAEQVSGPVGIFVLIKDGSLLGYQFILLIIAVISLTLAIMNSLPIPALDGGRLFVTLLYRAMRRPLKPKTEDFIHGTGFVIMILLFVLITVIDVRRFF